MTSTEGVALQVDDVYVPLGLVERKKQPKPQGDNISPEKGSEQYKETEITKTFEHNAFLEEVLKQQNTPKSKGRRIAIIGEPGAGKTTLLQKIADWVFCEIPQSIVIWVSLADLQGQKLEEYLLGTWLTAAVRKKGKSEPTQRQEDDFVALFNQRNVWLLLDGLDEMSAASGNPLTEISRQFRESGFISQARIVLTCRVNLWDGGINALDDFNIYRTLDFSYPQQVEKFIHKWFAAIPETGKQLCTVLKEPGKERIQDLVKNPLRLTLLCLTWQSGDGKLPDTQAGLYQRFVDDFYKWKQDEFPTTSHQKLQLNGKLGELAKTAIDKETIRFSLPQDFVNAVFNQEEDQVLLTLALNRGWLNCIKVDKQKFYAFFHASFQEYFAAIVIDNWYFFLHHVPKNPSRGNYRIFEPLWKQTILLWLGREEKYLQQQKQQFIDALVNFKDGYGKWNRKDVDKGFYEYQAYFLAAVGIVEFKDCSQADEIVNQIVKWGFGYSPISETAKLALQQTDRIKAITTLVQLLLSKDVDDSTRRLAASSLEKIGTGNQQAITALVQLLLSKDVDDSTRRLAASSLEKIGTGNQQAITALVQLLLSKDVDDSTRRLAASSLEKIDPGNQQAITALVQLLLSKDVDDSTRRLAASSLGKIDPGNQQAITALVQLLLSKDVDDKICWQAASSLEKIGTGNQQAIAALVQLLLSKDLDKDTRWQAASSLGKIGTGNQQAITALVQLLHSKDLDDFTRWQAASSLEKIDPGNQQAIATLVQLLLSKDVDDKICWQAAECLEKIDLGNQHAIAALVQLLLSKDLDKDTRWRAADSLGKIDPGNQQAIAALVQLLLSKDMDKDTRWRAADSLGEIGIGNQQAITALVQLLLSKDVDDFTRREAASSLGKIDPGNQQAIAALVQLLLSKDVDKYTRAWAADSLGEIGIGNQDAIAALVQLLLSKDVDDGICWQAADSLGEIGIGNQDAIAALVQLLLSKDVDDGIFWQAAECLEKIDPGNQYAIAALVQLLLSKDVDDGICWQAAECLGKIIQNNQHRFAVVKTLSGYWRLNDKQYDLAWKCAQNMPYPDFYQAWHQHNFATRTMRSLKQILFTRII
ncbi:putative NTPase (NACHT family) [Nostoc sp. PCC 7524]|uniref:HEAT repeat domain-containing protein n=1 Tax=Nostoc sp. (strain ATCC 29411 / PCC 7524) TaxID=28072 RepID=UPI00029EFDF2|nr:HEAT repeat domain-containing protein [Nostoc sp. PCC 7524]AFY50361.1 putative NTPase (NACHT family) [Nostoc sp. PCC 7524]